MGLGAQRERKGGQVASGSRGWGEAAGGEGEGGREHSRVHAASLTFSANADFKHPGAEAVAGRHAEALVGGIFLRAHENVVGGREAVRLDALHLHVVHVGKVDGPGGNRRIKINDCGFPGVTTRKTKNKHRRSGRGIIESNEKQGMRPWRTESSIRCAVLSARSESYSPFLIDGMVYM